MPRGLPVEIALIELDHPIGKRIGIILDPRIVRTPKCLRDLEVVTVFDVQNRVSHLLLNHRQ